MADKIERVVQFDLIANVQDALTQTKKLQEMIDKMGVPDSLKQSFIKAFGEIEKSGAKATAAFNRGLKDKKDINAYESATNKIGETFEHIGTLLTKIPKNVLESFFGQNIQKEIADIKKQVDDLNKSLEKSVGYSDYAKAKKAFKGGNKTIQNFETALQSGDANEIQKAIDQANKQAQKYSNKGTAGAWDALVKSMQAMVQDSSVIQFFKDLQNAQTNLTDAENRLNNATEQGTNFMNDQAAATRSGNQAISNMARADIEAAQAQNEMNQEMENFKNKITYFFGAANAINLLKRAARSAFATIKDLDKVMTEAAVVTNFSVGDMWSQLPEYTRRANELGVSVHDAYESATLFYQQGLKTNEVMAVSNETLKMARIAGLGAEDATKRKLYVMRLNKVIY